MSADTIGYVVRKTYFHDKPHEDIASFMVEPEFLAGKTSWTNAYTEALELAQEVRVGYHNGYAVIDRLYADGSRGQG